jgi:hypothetical protein
MTVTLLALPPPPMPPAPLPRNVAPATAGRGNRATANPPPRQLARQAPAAPKAVVLAIGDAAPQDGDGEISDGFLDGASTAGSDTGGGKGCNMPGRLQAALRRDHLVQAAVAEVHRGRALRVWNGDWVRHAGQEGAGLTAVREAILWEVAFAPEACRVEPMRGLVVLSLDDGPGAPRLVMGLGSWRWRDVLASRAGR